MREISFRFQKSTRKEEKLIKIVKIAPKSSFKMDSSPKIIMEFLPPEILMEILERTPKNDYNNVALVSKKFYEIICKIRMFEAPLEIKNATVTNKQYELKISFDF